MIDELGVTEEEARACVFFILAWRCIGNGPALRDKALSIIPEECFDAIPPEIIENIAVRLRRSYCGGNFEWVDRAIPGYMATLRDMPPY
jgi:hypothetical protein